MKEKLIDLLVVSIMSCSVAGLIYSFYLLRHGWKEKGYRLVLISVLVVLLLGVYLEYFD